MLKMSHFTHDLIAAGAHKINKHLKGAKALITARLSLARDSKLMLGLYLSIPNPARANTYDRRINHFECHKSCFKETVFKKRLYYPIISSYCSRVVSQVQTQGGVK